MKQKCNKNKKRDFPHFLNNSLFQTSEANNDFSDRCLNFLPKNFIIKASLMGSFQEYSKNQMENSPLFQKLEMQDVVFASKNLFSHSDSSNCEVKTYEHNQESIEFFRNVGKTYRSDFEATVNAKECEISEHSGYKSMNDLIQEANLIAKKTEHLFFSKSHCNI